MSRLNLSLRARFRSLRSSAQAKARTAFEEFEALPAWAKEAAAFKAPIMGLVEVLKAEMARGIPPALTGDYAAMIERMLEQRIRAIYNAGYRDGHEAGKRDEESYFVDWVRRNG